MTTASQSEPEKRTAGAGEAFGRLPFAKGQTVLVRLLAPVPPQFQGDGVVVTSMRDPSWDKLRALGDGRCGGHWRLEYVPPGHKNPTETYEITIDGPPYELELAKKPAPPAAVASKDDSIVEILLRTLVEQRSEQMQLFKLMLEQNHHTGAPAVSFDPAFGKECFLAGLESGTAGKQPAADVPSDWASVVRETVPAVMREVREMRTGRLVEAAARFMQPTSSPAALPNNPASPTAKPAAAPDALAAADGVPRWLVALVEELRRAIRIESGEDPEFTADWLTKYAPESVVTLIETGGPDLDAMIQQLAVHLPELTTPAGVAFVERVRRALLDTGAEPGGAEGTEGVA